MTPRPHGCVNPFYEAHGFYRWYREWNRSFCNDGTTSAGAELSWNPDLHFLHDKRLDEWSPHGFRWLGGNIGWAVSYGHLVHAWEGHVVLVELSSPGDGDSWRTDNAWGAL